IPVRGGNGALEALDFSPPKLKSVEAAAANGIRLQRGRVFVDLWDLQKFSDCDACFDQRRDRLARMNVSQVLEPEIVCNECQRIST
ncbi:MAG TPA: hypothetical protein VK850_07680, partial [Candidatus Binatia bacterium]|nr:hypothetical protein [Candidatus Binatia bacterium]